MFLSLIRSPHGEMGTTVQYGGLVSSSFVMRNGVRQRYVLAHALFAIPFSLLLCSGFSSVASSTWVSSGCCNFVLRVPAGVFFLLKSVVLGLLNSTTRMVSAACIHTETSLSSVGSENFFKLPGPKRNAISKKEEKEFDREFKRLEILEETSKKLYKDAKKCIEANTALSKSERKITQDLLASSLHQGDELRRHIEDWDSSLDKLDGHLQQLNTNIQRTVIDPMKKFNSIFPSVQVAKKKREQALEEYSRCQAKADKYEERPRTQSIAKRESSRKALVNAKDEFYQLHAVLMEDMPKLYEGRTDYFQPCLEAHIKSQVTYNSEAFKIYSELATQLNLSENLNTEDYVDRIQQRLQDIKALSITVDD